MFYEISQNVIDLCINIHVPTGRLLFWCHLLGEVLVVRNFKDYCRLDHPRWPPPLQPRISQVFETKYWPKTVICENPFSMFFARHWAERSPCRCSGSELWLHACLCQCCVSGAYAISLPVLGALHRNFIRSARRRFNRHCANKNGHCSKIFENKRSRPSTTTHWGHAGAMLSHVDPVWVTRWNYGFSHICL